MPTLFDTTVRTDVATYTFRSREEAEAFFLSLKNVTDVLADHTEGERKRAASSTRKPS
jgi:hypothetical protein